MDLDWHQCLHWLAFYGWTKLYFQARDLDWIMSTHEKSWSLTFYGILTINLMAKLGTI